MLRDKSKQESFARATQKVGFRATKKADQAECQWIHSFIHQASAERARAAITWPREILSTLSLSPLRVANWKFYLDQRRRNCAAAPDNKTEPFCRQMKLNFSAARVCFCAERYVFMSCPPHAIKAAQLLSLLGGLWLFSENIYLGAFARGLFAPPNFPFSECLSFCYLLLNCARERKLPIFSACGRNSSQDAFFGRPTRRVDNGVRLYCSVAEAPAVHCFSHCGVIFC